MQRQFQRAFQRNPPTWLTITQIREIWSWP